ncbi:hypothetical protein pb186bvf_017578 [Paramecium bursaria]
MADQFDYTKYLQTLHTVRKESDIEEISEEEEIIDLPQEVEFEIPPKEQDSILVNAKQYEDVEMQKPIVVYPPLPPLSKVLEKKKQRQFVFKSVDINQQMLKYESINYEIESSSNDKAVSVNRQYSDFEWLHEVLLENFPGIIVPSIPPRNLLAKFNITSYTGQIRAQRQKGLEEFLRKVLQHNQLKDSEILEKFMVLQDQEFKKLMNDYTDIKKQKVQVNVGKSVVKSQFEKLTSYFYSNTQVESEVERFFSFVKNEIITQKPKLRAIRDTLEANFIQKAEQSKQLLQISNLYEYLSADLKIERNIEKGFSCEIIQEQIYIIDVFILLIQAQQYILDLDVVLRVISSKEELQNQIVNHAAALQNQKQYNNDQRAVIQTQLNDLNKSMGLIIDNFKTEYENFSQMLNYSISQILGIVVEQLQNIDNKFHTVWSQ